MVPLNDILIHVKRQILGDQLSWLEHLPYKQGVIGSSPISPTIFYAEIAQQVEQLTCNQQVTGSIPVFGTIFFLEGQRSGQTRQTVNLFLRVPWFKSMSSHHFCIALQPSGKASDFDSDIPMVRVHPRQPFLFRQLSRQSI